MSIERRIAIGLITSTEYLEALQAEWNPEYMESPTAKMVSQWCWEYFKKRGKAPNDRIELIFEKKVKKGIDDSLAEDIELNILPSLSDESEEEEFDLEDLLLDTREHFEERGLHVLTENVVGLLEKGKVEEATKLVEDHKIKTGFAEMEQDLDLTSDDVLPALDETFNRSFKPVLRYSGALGEFWNHELVRGGFVSLLAPEKRGKSYFLLDMMIRAHKQGQPVAFFQAGDMTEGQQLMRAATNLTGRPTKDKYLGKQFVPVMDCVKNQNNQCTHKIRESRVGVFDDKTIEELRKQTPTMDEMKEAYEMNPKYKRCFNCSEFSKHKWGTAWIKEKEFKRQLTVNAAKRVFNKKIIGTKNKIRLSTHANGTLTVAKMIAKLNEWEKQGFFPKLILIDYMDLFVPKSERQEFRHQQNEIWKAIRGVSQDRDALIVAPTQADALAHETTLLTLKNFSEDKRKFAHVTAMYGLNQDPEGIEKGIGILRINKIIIREDEFHSSHQVHVLQNLSIGKPILESYF
jgi:hypothetical protein